MITDVVSIVCKVQGCGYIILRLGQVPLYVYNIFDVVEGGYVNVWVGEACIQSYENQRHTCCFIGGRDGPPIIFFITYITRKDTISISTIKVEILKRYLDERGKNIKVNKKHLL